MPAVPLPQLHTSGFDSEQIWEQLETYNRPCLRVLEKEGKKVSREFRTGLGGEQASVKKVTNAFFAAPQRRKRKRQARERETEEAAA
eukprot:CAMPEP_0119136580 /NCGR_PEP_ID=MMETSP1310-20130426/21734_1 /TAXON_ID=464262 /ORGANISM="Genus nov. species nov., Strain RCC2339" /LENGTH=86 /DNA_ID=CAMNT_0007127583 /DNA_START=69 /DNA_END=326 /DNA_ORIENTATION=+